nr:hypothetical protein [Tanacetum cinerariifolium]
MAAAVANITATSTTLPPLRRLSPHHTPTAITTPLPPSHRHDPPLVTTYTTEATATAAIFPAAAAAVVKLIDLPISCLFFHAWGCPPPNHHRGGGRMTVQPPQPHLVVSGCDGATTSEESGRFPSNVYYHFIIFFIHYPPPQTYRAATRASISKPYKRSKINIIPPKQLFIDLTNDDTKTPSPSYQVLSPSALNAPLETPSIVATSSSSIDYKTKSPTSSTSPSTCGYLNLSLSPLPRVPPPPPTQESRSMDINLTLSPMTLLDVQFNTPSPPLPLFGHLIP